jgi:hypothetical protein
MNTDYAVKPPLYRFFFLTKFGLLAFMLALLGLLRISRELSLRGFTRIFVSLGGALVVSFVVLGLIIMGFLIWAKLATRRGFRDNPSSFSDEAEKFYYLALWGALRKNVKFSRRMLKHAMSHGFRDKLRLADPLLALALPGSARRLLR